MKPEPALLPLVTLLLLTAATFCWACCWSAGQPWAWFAAALLFQIAVFASWLTWMPPP